MASKKRKAVCVEKKSADADADADAQLAKKNKKAVAQAMFNRAVESRVARYMKQNDILVLRMHQELCHAKTNLETCVHDLEKHKQVIAQQQAEIVRLKSELKEMNSREPLDRAQVLSKIFELPNIEDSIDTLFADEVEIEPIPLTT